MNISIIVISLRNLTRQKRRNFLLGAAIAIGMMILVIAGSFSHGISDTMFNRIMRYVTGHVTVGFNEKGGMQNVVCRDRERIFNVIRECDSGVITGVDEAIGIFTKAIGNGKSDNTILVGIDMFKKYDEEEQRQSEEDFQVVDGGFDDIKRTDVENPALVSEEKARYLNVKKGDIIRLRFRNIYGQDQTARLTVAGIMKTGNIFMQPVVFAELANVKRIVGYRLWETGNINIVLKNPQKNAVPLADRIHKKLSPGIAFIRARVLRGGPEVTILGYKTDEQSRKKMPGIIGLTQVSGKLWTKDGVLISKNLSRILGITAGGRIEAAYAHKFDSDKTTVTVTVTGIFNSAEGPDKNMMLLSEEKFYDIYYDNLPAVAGLRNACPAGAGAQINFGKAVTGDGTLESVLAPEWVLLERTSNTDELKKKLQDMGKNKWKATLIDVRTMYESASDILKLEGVLNIITFSAVLVLFFIILIGVVNTLRMTIMERTREIGTIRAIGMQKKDVRNIFILETLFLTVIASVSGIVLSFAVMYFLSLVPFNIQDNPLGMLLVKNRLHFIPTISGITWNLLTILLIAVVTAYFPARRAANLPPAKALRHFE